jgi:Domain of unknown function (DUF427)
VRARIGKRIILDTTHAQLLFEDERHPGGRYPKTPCHRVDALPSGRHIQILINGEPLATTCRLALIIETGVPPRWYIPPGDIRWDRLTPGPHRTTCQYKGQACYWTADGTNPPLAGVELRRTAARGREPGRAHRHSRWRPGSATAHQRRPGPPQGRRLTHAPARLAAGSRTLGWADDIGPMTIEGAMRAVRHSFLLVRHPGPRRATLTRGASYWTAWYSLRLA